MGTSLFLVVLFSCNRNDMKIDYSSAIGKYKSNYKKGTEILELKSDSTFIYQLIVNQNKRYKDVGHWFLSERDNQITFYDWCDRIFIGYNSKKDYIASQQKMFNIILNPNEIPKKEVYNMKFIIAIKSFKKSYVLRRSIDLQEEYDFIKQE